MASAFLVNAIYVLGLAQSPASTAQERKLKTKEFKDIPLKVVAIRNLNSGTWYNDLEIDIKNTSDKPIYSILAYLVFDDIKIPGGESAIRLMYGDPKNGLIRTRASTRDTHLEPGETYVFAVPEMYKKGLKAKHEKLQELTKNLVIRFARISFGDGTGYEVGRPREYEEKEFKPPPEPKKSKKTRRNHSITNSTSAQSECGGVNLLEVADSEFPWPLIMQ